MSSGRELLKRYPAVLPSQPGTRRVFVLTASGNRFEGYVSPPFPAPLNSDQISDPTTDADIITIDNAFCHGPEDRACGFNVRTGPVDPRALRLRRALLTTIAYVEEEAAPGNEPNKHKDMIDGDVPSPSSAPVHEHSDPPHPSNFAVVASLLPIHPVPDAPTTTSSQPHIPASGANNPAAVAPTALSAVAPVFPQSNDAAPAAPQAPLLHTTAPAPTPVPPPVLVPEPAPASAPAPAPVPVASPVPLPYVTSSPSPSTRGPAGLVTPRPPHAPPTNATNRTITAVPDVLAGHWTNDVGTTGVTVIRFARAAVGAVAVLGGATGSRELDVLRPEHAAPRLDAIVLSGGSAFGLAAASGAADWLGERGIGHKTVGGRVPIVPSAIIYDLTVGTQRPTADGGRAAAEAATSRPLARGRIGVGAGARCGKFLGPQGAALGGVGSSHCTVRTARGASYDVGAVVVVNAVGSILGHDGAVIAGPDPAALLSLGRPDPPPPVAPYTNTTLAVVATSAPLSKAQLATLARMAAGAYGRHIAPIFSPHDGDLVFAVSTGRTADATTECDAVLMQLGYAAAKALGEAIVDAVAP